MFCDPTPQSQNFVSCCRRNLQSPGDVSPNLSSLNLQNPFGKEEAGVRTWGTVRLAEAAGGE